MSPWTWVLLLKRGRFALNLESIDLEDATFLTMGDEDPTVISPFWLKEIGDCR